MSEYQFVHFLAIDRPLDDRQLAFMEKQSTRAEITRWEFTNEYHYGDFHGDARKMLQRGYDLHLHYANFGMRRLMIRLPAGLPCDRRTFAAFATSESMKWLPDQQGKGGILEIYPEADADTFDEVLYDVDRLLPEIAPVRELLMGGDLRALYLAWLICPYEDEALEPPVPAGLGKLTSALKAMAEFYEISEDLIAAAALRSPPMPATKDAGDTLKQWIAKQSPGDLRELVERFLSGDAGAARAETLARIQQEMGAVAWPMAEPTRTVAQLREATDGLQQRRLEKEERAREAARRKRLKSIAENPDKLIAKVEKLVEQRSLDSYEQAAQELCDLRDATDREDAAELALAQAEKLRRDNPHSHHLIATLRRHGLLRKPSSR